MPRPQFRRIKLIIASVCLIQSTTLLQPPRLNAVEPLSTIAAVATAMSAIARLFDSGSDLTRTLVGQNRELLLDNRQLLIDINKRFNNFGRELEGMLHKLDDLPPIMRKEMRGVVDEFQQNKVLATVQLIVGDREIQKAGGILATDPRDRLRTLQTESRTLLQRSDLNVPVFMVAMAYELAFLEAMEASHQEITRRRQDYTDRLLQALDMEREESLLSQYLNLSGEMEKMVNARKRRFSALKTHYDDTGCSPGGVRYEDYGSGNYCEPGTQRKTCDREKPRPDVEKEMTRLAREMRSGRFEAYAHLGRAYVETMIGILRVLENIHAEKFQILDRAMDAIQREIYKDQVRGMGIKKHLREELTSLNIKIREHPSRENRIRGQLLLWNGNQRHQVRLWKELQGEVFRYRRKSPSFWSYSRVVLSEPMPRHSGGCP